MSYFLCRRKSYREVNRFEAIDQDGIQHTVVERLAILHEVGASGRIFNSQKGSSPFYSATTGETIIRRDDGSFEDLEGVSFRRNPVE